jgi:hypothetical protein
MGTSPLQSLLHTRHSLTLPVKDESSEAHI